MLSSFQPCIVLAVFVSSLYVTGNSLYIHDCCKLSSYLNLLRPVTLNVRSEEREGIKPSLPAADMGLASLDLVKCGLVKIAYF